MKKRIIDYFYNGSIEKYNDYTIGRLLVITAIGVTVINTILRMILV